MSALNPIALLAGVFYAGTTAWRCWEYRPIRSLDDYGEATAPRFVPEAYKVLYAVSLDAAFVGAVLLAVFS